MKKGRTTLVLFLCIVLAGTFIWLQEKGRMKTYQQAYANAKVFGLDMDSIVSLKFEGTHVVVDCVKQNGVWMTGKAGEGLGLADDALMKRVIADFNRFFKSATISSEEVVNAQKGDAEYGFGEPLARITAVDASGTHTWIIGGRTALGKYVYMKLKDEQDIFLVEDKILKMIPDKVDLLRDRSLFAGVVSGVRRVELRGTGGFVQIVNDPKTGWQIQQPVNAYADQVKMASFLDRLYQLRIEDFVADNVSDFSIYGLQGAGRQISLGGSDGAARMLVLGEAIPDRDGYIYARRADDTSVFALKKEVQDLVMFSLEDFRDRRVLTLEPADISTISIRRGASQLEVRRDEADGWDIVQPMRWRADRAAVERLLRIWTRAFVVEFDDAPTKTNEVVWVLQFGSDQKGETNRVEILSPTATDQSVRFRRSSTVRSEYTISLSEIPDSIIDPLMYKDLQVLQLRAADVQRLKLVMAGQEESQVVVRKDEAFVLDVPSATLQVNTEAVQSILQQLSSVMAADYVAYNVDDLSVYGLEVPTFALHISLSGAKKIGQVLLIGKETGKGYYAMIQGHDVVFLLDKNDTRRLTGNIVIPEVLSSEVSDVIE